MKLIGIVLIVGGLLALAFGGFSYLRREKVLDLGPLQVTAQTRRDVPIAPLTGAAALLAGAVLVILASKAAAGKSNG